MIWFFTNVTLVKQRTFLLGFLVSTTSFGIECHPCCIETPFINENFLSFNLLCGLSCGYKGVQGYLPPKGHPEGLISHGPLGSSPPRGPSDGSPPWDPFIRPHPSRL